ncbi:uncharacterized protein G2W53_009033 [Senna tora]|uniref:Uncharacterized protein n=1 Tax=Senna tora TaxID=362788 RepID=A0A834WX94_9FABA|nr:uncharacterized protein G2W53_009033 [Senna tora]
MALSQSEKKIGNCRRAKKMEVINEILPFK